MALTDLLTQIADSIRSKDGTTEPILATDFPQRIMEIPSDGSDIESCDISLVNSSSSILIPTKKKCTDINYIIMVPINATPFDMSGNQYIGTGVFFTKGITLGNGKNYYCIGIYNNWGKPSALSIEEPICNDADSEDGIYITGTFSKGAYRFIIE